MAESRPRIIIATTAFAPFVGGAEVAVQEYIKLLKNKFDFVVVTARMRRELSTRDIWEGVRVIRVGWGTRYDKVWFMLALPLYVLWLRMQSAAPTLVWAIMASYAGAGACITRVLTGTRYVLTLQEGDNLKVLEQRLHRAIFFFRQIFIRARSIQVIAPFLSEWAKKNGARSEIIVVSNGVSVKDFSISAEDRSIWRKKIREELHIPNDAPVVLSVSRLVQKNGLADLIQAIGEISECHLVIIGDGDLRDDLVKRAKNFSARVHFLGTKMSAEILQYGAASDVFCRASLSEGFGNVFLEAMCMGLPVLATTVGGIPTIITDGVNGFLVPPHEYMQLEHRLRELFQNQNKSKDFVALGTHTIQKFRWEILAPQIGEWLNKCVQS